MTDAKTYPNNVYNDFVNTGNNGGADWDPTLVRYVFIDGDLGDDNHSGYLDAPPGHVFSPAEAFTVAIKTTRRLDQIRPAIGNGRMLVTLWKPRAARAPYDYAVEGDGRGVNDRGRLSGYGLLHDRGSDHTNSADDKQQLGFVAPGGPVLSWPVGAVNPAGINGPEISLVGAAFVDPWADILPYRVKVTKADTSVITLPPRWGDTTVAARANVVTIKPNVLAPSVIDPGDVVSFEVPGVVLWSYVESHGSAETVKATGLPPSFPPLLVAGFAVRNGTAFVGCNGSAQPPQYTGFETGVGTAGTRVVGSLTGGPLYIDEAQNLAGKANYGLLCHDGIIWGGGGPEAMPQSFNPNFSVLAGPSEFMAGKLDCAFVSALHTQLSGLSERAELNTWDYVDLELRCSTNVGLTGCRAMPSGRVTINASTFNDLKRRRESSVGFSNCIDLVPGSNAATIGVAIASGAPLVTFDFADAPNPTVLLGSGVSMQLDAGVIGTSFIIPRIRWESLRVTGFEVADGGPKVVCRLAATHLDQWYQDDTLPCPRSFPHHFLDIEGAYPATIPAGTVVAANPRDYTTNGLIIPTLGNGLQGLPVLGVLTTNADTPGGGVGGTCLVCVDDVAVALFNYDAGPPNNFPVPGSQVYADYDANAGKVTKVPQFINAQNGIGPVVVGVAMPWGPVNTGLLVIKVCPTTMPYQQSQIAYTSRTSDALTAIATCQATVKAYHKYKLTLRGKVGGGALGGYKVAVDSPDGAVISEGGMMHKLIGVSGGAALVTAGTVTTLGAAIAGGVGITEGIWEMDGYVWIGASGGTLCPYFAQSVTDETSNYIGPVTWEVQEQQ